ncbi:cytosine-purine permease [Mycena epipterygia]|nr:cytosine-purine permease [Mycena epipterygia]
MANVEEKVDLDAPDATFSQRLANFLRRWGVETHGIAPIPKEQRTDPRSYQLFLLWFSSNMNIANLVVGATGPVVFNLSLKDTAINLLITNALSCIIPAYFAIFGPKLGTRALVQARFSWGVYGVAIPSLLNVVSMVGFLFLNVIIGGQLLAGVSHRLTPNVGIVIIALVSLVVSFCGYKFLHWFESLAWIPTVVGIAVMLGAGGKHLASAPPYPTPSVASTLSFAATVAASDLTWCTVSPDYGVYHDASGPRIFTYTYLGIFVPSLLLHVVGAAFAAAAPGVPSWKAGYNGGNDLGGLVSAVLEPCGWFGKFLVAVMALAIAAPSAPTLYSFGISLMNVHSVFAKVPRYVFAIIGTVICIPLGVVGQTRFYSVLVTALDVMGYWCASYAGIVFIEHIVFRRRDFAKYKLEDWDRASKLPLGLAALLSFFGSLALVVPFMAQTWYTGPIAKAGTGDIGLLVGFFSSCILYGALRPFEIRWFPSHSS